MKVIDRESNKTGTLISEAIWNRQNNNMNREDESY